MTSASRALVSTEFVLMKLMIIRVPASMVGLVKIATLIFQSVMRGIYVVRTGGVRRSRRGLNVNATVASPESTATASTTPASPDPAVPTAYSVSFNLNG